jgi:hypothetical protein
LESEWGNRDDIAGDVLRRYQHVERSYYSEPGILLLVGWRLEFERQWQLHVDRRSVLLQHMRHIAVQRQQLRAVELEWQ